jgi:hypothetical protein
VSQKISLEGTQQMHCYYFDSLLTQARQYAALQSVYKMDMKELLINPVSQGSENFSTNFFDVHGKHFNKSQIEVLQKVLSALPNSVTLV